MKNLFLTCMVLFLVFTFGCQDSFITDPTQPLAENQDAQFTNDDLIKDKPDDVNHNIIGLNYQLTDPRGEGTCQLTGQVSYFNTIIQPIAVDGKVWVKVRLEMIALLCHLSKSDQHPRWKIEKKTEDKMFFTDTGSAVKRLCKTYSITNRANVELCVTYSITYKSVKVVEVFLRAIDVEEDDDATN